MKPSHSKKYSPEHIFTVIPHLEHSLLELCIDCLIIFDKDEFCARFNANLFYSVYLCTDHFHLRWGVSNRRQISNDNSLYVLVCSNFLKPTPWGTFRSDFVRAMIHRRVLYEDFIDSTLLNDGIDEYSSIIIGLPCLKCTGINSVCVPLKDLWFFLSNSELGSRVTLGNSSAKSYFWTSLNWCNAIFDGLSFCCSSLYCQTQELQWHLFLCCLSKSSIYPRSILPTYFGWTSILYIEFVDPDDAGHWLRSSILLSRTLSLKAKLAIDWVERLEQETENFGKFLLLLPLFCWRVSRSHLSQHRISTYYPQK